MFLDPRNRLILATAWIAFALSPAVRPASGQTPTTKEGDQFLVNTYTTDNQRTAAIAMGSGREFVVAWSSAVSDGDSYAAIQGRIFDSEGQPVGADFLVNSYTTSAQAWPEVAVDEDGGFVVVWSSLGADNGDPDGFSVQGQRFGADGRPIGSQFLVNSYTNGSQFYPSIAMADAGQFVVVWMSTETDTDLSFGIHGRRFASSGDALGDQFLINSYTPGAQRQPDVAMDGEGDFVVAWESFGPNVTDSDGLSIQARRFASGGSPIGDQFQVNTYTAGDQDDPSVAVNAAGRFVVAWTSDGTENGDSSPYSVHGQRFASDGTALGLQFLVNGYTTGSQAAPSISIDGDGGFVVVWDSFGSDNGDPDFLSVQGQRYTQDGTPVGDQFLVNAYTTGPQLQASVAAEPRGDFVVVFFSNQYDNGDLEAGSIQGQRFRVTADIGDLVFRDENLDGLQTPGEPGVEGVPVHLYESDGDLLESTVTDADGAFLFQPKIALQGVADEFFVRYEAPADLQFTAANTGADDTIDSDAEPMSGETGDFVVVSAGEDRTDFDAGLADGIGNRVWVDLDANGIQDGGEPGVGGVSVILFDGTGAPRESTTTSADGYYGFPNQVTGLWYVVVTAPDGYVFTAQDQGVDDEADSDVDPTTGETATFSYTLGDLQTQWDAGLIENVSEIGDRVWLDAGGGGAGNGVQDGGESGVAGVTVNLYREPDPPSPEGPTLEASTATDGDGLYSFTVEPGTYFLEFACAAPDSFTAQDQGGDDALDSDVDPATGTTSSFLLTLGIPDATRDAGLLDPDGDGIATCFDNCPSNPDPNQTDSDGDGSGDPCDLCAGDDAGGDADGDGLCAGSPFECDDMDPTNACAIVFGDGFESGDTTAWSTTVN